MTIRFSGWFHSQLCYKYLFIYLNILVSTYVTDVQTYLLFNIFEEHIVICAKRSMLLL